MFDWNAVFKRELAQNVSIGKSGEFDFFRPDYTSSSTTETQLNLNGPVDGRVDASGPTYAKTKISGAQYFDLFFDRDNPQVQAGDVIVRNPVDYTPAITVLECEDLQQAVGIKTSSIGTLSLSRETQLVTNIRFNYATGTSTSAPGVDPSDPGSLELEVRKIITWARPQIKQDMFFKDNASKRTYKITEIQGDGPVLICFLEIPSRFT